VILPKCFRPVLFGKTGKRGIDEKGMELLTAQSANRLCEPIELSVVYRENQGFWGTTAPDFLLFRENTSFRKVVTLPEY
jgi:hypothetical protein